MLQPFLEGWPLHQVIEAKRLFMVDLEILQDLPCKSDDFVVTVIFNLYFCEAIEIYLIRFAIFSSLCICFIVPSAHCFIFHQWRRTIGPHCHPAVPAKSRRQSGKTNTRIVLCMHARI